jgi:prepilin-type N-terminal cleavage/methylation domain-containing protein/prepilin-type processing-associated H-X9-DG protein
MEVKKTAIEGRTKHSRLNSGFTLVELLVTISIILILAGTLLPALARAKSSACSVSCVGNFRQLGMGVEMYANDNKNHLPGCQHSLPSWKIGLAPYSGTNVYYCPNDAMLHSTETNLPERYSIALNDFLTPHPYGARTLDYSVKGSIPAPAETILFAETARDYLGMDHFHFANAAENGFTPDRFAGQVEVQRHGASANYLFADGHVLSLRWPTVEGFLTSAGSRFVHPEGKSAGEVAR